MKSRLLLSISSALVMISCSVGSNGTTNSPNQLSLGQIKSDFNLNQLSEPSPGISSLYSVPANICPGVPIWRGGSGPIPGGDPISPPSDQQCELNETGKTQNPRGCSVNHNKPNSLGYNLTRSVVGIALPAKLNPKTKKPTYWNLRCSGTIIGNKWILTAGHCFETTFPIPPKGSFKPELEQASVYIVPWQTYSYNGISYNGVPPRFLESSNIEKYRVKTIYLPQHFDDYGIYPANPPSPYPLFKFADFAVLELETPLPNSKKAPDGTNWFKPLPLRTQTFKHQEYIWNAGYGENESQIKTGQLHYQQEYFVSQYYEPNSILQFQQSATALNYSQIYTYFTPGSIRYKGENSAWSFFGAGDSGGPVIYFAKDKKYYSHIESPEIIGVIDSSISCNNYVGFLAPESAAYIANANVIEFSGLINSIMNGTAPESATRQVTPRSFHGYVYVVDSYGNKIHIYSENTESGQLFLESQLTSIQTGSDPRSITFHPNGKYAYTVNSTANSISQYNVLSTGELNPLTPSQIGGLINPRYLAFAPSGKFAYITTVATNSGGNNAITLLIESQGKLTLTKSKFPTGKAPIFATFSPNGQFVYVVNSQDNSISMFSSDQQNGLLTRLNPFFISTGNTPTEIVFDPNGEYAYVPNYNSNSISIYTMLANGQLNFKSVVQLTKSSPRQIILSPGNGDYAYVNVLDINATPGLQKPGILKFKVNHTTGELSCDDTTCPQFIQSPGGAAAGFITFDLSGTYIFATSAYEGNSTINWFNADPARGGGDLNAEVETTSYPGLYPGMIATNLAPNDSDDDNGPSSSGPGSSSGS